MNEANDILEAILLDIENLQGAMRVFASAFRDQGAFNGVNPQDIEGAFTLTTDSLEEIHGKANKALEWVTFSKYHGEEGGKA